MKIAQHALPVALTIAVGFQAHSLSVLREELRHLADQVQSVSSGLAQQKRSSATLQHALNVLGAGLAAGAGEQRAVPPTEEKLKGIVADQIKKRQEQERSDAELALQGFADEVRLSATRELRASDLEVEHLVELGNRLHEGEAALQENARGLTEQESNEARVRLWDRTDGEVRAVLGVDRYARWEALRRDHPEYARSLYALRSSPAGVAMAQSAPDQRSAVAAVTHETR
jgi:hypothetical protein